MPRKRLVRTSENPYHICLRTNNKDWFPLPLNECWSIYENYLHKGIEKYGIEVHAFVLMGNHIHLLMSTPLSNLDLFMRFFSTQTSKRIGWRSSKINHLYGSRYHWNILETQASYSIVLKYVFRNPVKAGICDDVKDYMWSSLNLNFDKFKARHRLSHSSFVPTDRKNLLLWLNDSPNPDLEKNIGLNLKKVGQIKALKDQRNFLIDTSDYFDANLSKR